MSGSGEIVIGLDTASRICEACVTGSDGNIIESVNFVTSAMKLISVVSRFPDAVVVLEESSMAQWAYETLSGRVKDVFVCDPKHNKWISSGMKSDRVDAHKLTVLYRVKSLHRVYHSLDGSRVEFKRTIQHREWLVKDMTRLKNEIKARFRLYGIIVAGRRSPFESPAGIAHDSWGHSQTFKHSAERTGAGPNPPIDVSGNYSVFLIAPSYWA